jgi:hypothetical protein
MPRHTVTESAIVNAPAERVYAILADYRHGHPRILPRPPFEELEVEQGGVGAGTVIRCQMRMLGRRQTLRAAITEPEPGRVLVETELGGQGIVTTFTVDPEGPGARVSISTDVPTRGGLLGIVQRFLVTRLLRPTYVRELEQLDALAASGYQTPSPNSPAPVK